MNECGGCTCFQRAPCPHCTGGCGCFERDDNGDPIWDEERDGYKPIAEGRKEK